MVKNKRAKGLRNQKKIIDELENDGWLVAVVERTGRFIKVKDMFGLFDLVAIKKHKVKFIQASTNVPHTHKHLLSFAIQFAHKNLEIIQFTWFDRRGFKVFNYTWNKGMLVEDRRK